MVQKMLDDIHSPRIKKMILDTDTYNEIDDQFALAYALLAKDKVEVLSVNAAPFHNGNSSSPEDGMERSYNEIFKILDMIEPRPNIPVYRGSRRFLVNEETPEDTDAARNIINTALSMPEGELLYVVAIGAITNVASALLLEPSIKNRIAIVWLGGNALHLNSTHEFNMIQDIPAAKIVFNSGAPLCQIPCHGVCTLLTTTVPELEYCLGGKNALCDYLVQNVKNCFSDPFGKSRVIWDASAVATLVYPNALSRQLIPTPIVTYEGVYSTVATRKRYLYTIDLNRDAIIGDMFRRLSNMGK